VDVPTRIWPVGRLDLESEGALLLTNDGDLTLRLTHPRYELPKTYVVEVEGAVGRRVVQRLERGVELEDGLTAPAKASILEKRPGSTLVEMTIREGRNRQVRRMMEGVGHPVRRLVRVSIGPLVIGRLGPGAFRKLGPAEVQSLYRAADGGS
jgi:pseudouridine synthase